MTLMIKEKAEACAFLSELIDKVVITKNLFCGQGLYYQNNMFAIYNANCIYLRAKDELAKVFESHGAILWTSNPFHRRVEISFYYQIPKLIMENKELYRKLILLSIQQVIKENTDKQLNNVKLIRKLPNLSLKHENTLAKINIFTVEELQKNGAEYCFVQLKKNGYSVSIKFYWKLVCALKRKYVEHLTQQEKELCFNKLNQLLEKEGLRKIRNL